MEATEKTHVLRLRGRIVGGVSALVAIFLIAGLPSLFTLDSNVITVATLVSFVVGFVVYRTIVTRYNDRADAIEYEAQKQH